MGSFSTVEMLDILGRGVVELEGLVPWGSNYTFLVRVCLGERWVMGIYKPREGERPLWDFPRGTLCLRERAAYLVSEAIGWGIVPPTVLREGPHGWGSVQLFVAHDPEITYFDFQGGNAAVLSRIALFDLFTNNADRKAGHIIRDEAGGLWGIDHGICFHVDHKLRTVVWEFAGRAIAPELLEAMVDLRDGVGQMGLEALLSVEEVMALERRLEALLQQGHFPEPGQGRHYPWPLV